MAATREKVGVELLVQAKLDPKATARAIRDTTALHKKLSSLRVDWADIAKHSSANVKELRSMSTAASTFAKHLSKATQTSLKGLTDLGEQLGEAREKAADLSDQLSRAKTPAARKSISGDLSSVSKQIVGLNKQINLHKTADKKQINELKNVVKAQRNYRAGLESAAKYGGKDFLKDLTNSIGTKSMKGFMRGTGAAVGKAAKGAAARGAIEGGAGLGGAGGGAAGEVLGLSKALPALLGGMTAFAAVIGGLWKVLAMASDHQTKLNKTLLEGTGTASDFVSNVASYTGAISDLRSAVQSTSGGFLKLGVDSEQRLKIINKFATESTGSLIKTRNTMETLGSGNLQEGVDKFTRSAIAYGKALGMEATDVAGMMGNFVSEVGYGAGQVQDIMGNVVKTAATANMPLTKFMDIFRSVLPNVELFTNRIEELTGVIKLLSKAMSPKDIKAFMDAFGKGFKGMSFKDRLGKVLVAGVGNVNKILQKDFSSKADVMAAKFSDISPALGAAFKNAFATGDAKAMKDVLIQAKGTGKVSGTDIGEAQKLMGTEMERRKGAKGDVLAMASALKGAGLWSTIKVMGAEMKRFGMGGRITGISEQVAEKRGYSQEQIDAMNQLISTMGLYQQSLKDYGTSGSKSMDDALKGIIAAATGKKVDDITSKDMENATEDQIAAASEASNNAKDTARTAEDLAVEQVNVTTSISDKIDNVIAFLLEKAVMQLQGILDIFNDLWSWLTSGKSQQEMTKELEGVNKGIQASGYSADVKAQFDILTKDIEGVVAAGHNDFASLADTPGFENLAKLDPGVINKMAEARGDTSGTTGKSFAEAIAKGDKKGAISVLLERLPGDMAKNMQEVGQDLLVFGTSKAAKAAGEARTATRRPGTKEEKPLTAKEQKAADAAKEAADVVEITPEMIAAKAAKDATIGKKAAVSGAAAPVRIGTTTVERPIPKGAPVRIGTTTVERPVPKGVPAPAGAVPAPAPADKVAAKGQEKSTDEIVAAHESASDIMDKGLGDVYDGVDDVVGILKKGIKYNSSFLIGPYQKILKAATLDSFQEALLEFAVIQAKMQTDDSLVKKMADSAWNISEAGVSLKDIAHVTEGKAGDELQKMIEDKEKAKTQGGMQMGGPIPNTGDYKLHKGEAVLDAGTYGSLQRGIRDGGVPGGGTTVHLSITAAPNWTPKQFEDSVYHAMDKAARRS